MYLESIVISLLYILESLCESLRALEMYVTIIIIIVIIMMIIIDVVQNLDHHAKMCK